MSAARCGNGRLHHRRSRDSISTQF
jgi:hypothetical protein